MIPSRYKAPVHFSREFDRPLSPAEKNLLRREKKTWCATVEPVANKAQKRKSDRERLRKWRAR